MRRARRWICGSSRSQEPAGHLERRREPGAARGRRARSAVAGAPAPLGDHVDVFRDGFRLRRCRLCELRRTTYLRGRALLSGPWRFSRRLRRQGGGFIAPIPVRRPADHPAVWRITSAAAARNCRGAAICVHETTRTTRRMTNLLTLLACAGRVHSLASGGRRVMAELPEHIVPDALYVRQLARLEGAPEFRAMAADHQITDAQGRAAAGEPRPSPCCRTEVAALHALTDSIAQGSADCV